VTDEPETPTSELSADGAAGQEPMAEQQTASWLPQPSPAEPAYGAMAAADRPEVAVGAAFAGGLLAALILKRLAR
jgi:hypothetical protein